MSVTEITENNPRKDVALEALRGLAAFVVVFWHMLLGFAYGRVPALGGDQSASIMGKPWFGLVYGTSSVTFFFVLSGFVLSRKALLRADPMILARGAVKRWPRLAGTVTLAVLFSWLLFVTHAYRYAQAAAITGSPWLASFATSIPTGTEFHPNFFKALKQGLVSCFLNGDVGYDSSLWTMRIEFIGSFIVFGLAAILIALRATKPVVRAWIVIVAFAICHYAPGYEYMVCFVIGVALAALIGERRPIIPLWFGIALAVLAVWLAGYYPGAGWYGWVTAKLHYTPLETYVHTLGSLLVIFVIEATPALRRLLSGRISAWLGKLSFPLYLLHVPVLCSAGAAVFLATQGNLPGIGSKLAAMATTVLVSIALAWALANFDIWWVRKVGGITDRLVPRPPVSPSLPSS